MEQEADERVELAVSDPGQLGGLQSLLSLAGLDAYVQRTAGGPGPREQGAADVLVLLAGSSSLVAAIKVLPEFLRSRRTGLSITATVKGKPFTITVTNVDEVMPIMEKLLDD